MQPLEAGEPQTIGAYRLLGRLGAGGMGRVYLGRSAGGRTVAVKVVHPHFASDDEFRARFRREVEAARQVGGDWTAPVLDADPDASVPWVATGYVAGPPLGQAIGEYGPLPEHAVRTLGAGLAEALAAVHELGLVHRDVKPSNVLLTLDGPRLIDFGIARATDGTASLTSTGVSIGSPGYMSPEQILGKGVTGAADVFSLGAVLAYAASGTPPFPGDNSATLLYKVVHEEPEFGEHLRGELRELIADCLAKAPGTRPGPREIASRLAPGGAASMVATGWLPGPLVEQVSRAAVRLLDLEPQASAPGGSGPVPFSSPSVGGASVGGASAGAFGPPDPSYGEAVPQQREPQDAPPGRLALSVTANSVRAGDGERRGRKLSCTVALAVAAALAAVTVGGVFVLDLLPGRGGEDADTAGEKPPAASSSSSAPSDTEQSPPAGSRSTVPDGMVGTWKGTVTVNAGVSTTFEITVKKGKVGDVVGRDRSVIDLLGTKTDCSGDWKLASATDRSVVLDTSGNINPAPGICSNGSPEERFSLNTNGTLHYKSGDALAGNPEGDLKRQ
ncbi:serine/threonine protein kinase [Streptomyces sp. A3M-1-3]|uniref:serine/threonine-protein kinase n=1 Tax=Streptomyces sp. A3M-1-3 TaxID=2962044 RepID=UPI0020B7057F|nr:serine/threonine-protein kinase [Streptomyces sp. A3M-1-3]MCP3822404.1 serine/threonine protein kinase [Streptomyces sp. A3M-1-3]